MQNFITIKIQLTFIVMIYIYQCDKKLIVISCLILIIKFVKVQNEIWFF